MRSITSPAEALARQAPERYNLALVEGRCDLFSGIFVEQARLGNHNGARKPFQPGLPRRSLLRRCCVTFRLCSSAPPR
jgi:hypothetical protein